MSEHQESAESLGTTSKYTAERRGENPGFGNFVQGSCLGGAIFRIRIVSTVSIDRKDSGKYAHNIPMVYHREEVLAEPGRYVDESGGRVSYGVSRYTVSDHVHWPQVGDGSPVFGVVTYF